MFQWSLKSVAVKDLKPHPKNPRTLSREQGDHLTKSLIKFGLIDKPIVNLDMTIIGGHQRISILKKNKAKYIEVWVPDVLLSDLDVEELNIRLNKNHGSFDYEILANEFDVPNLLDWGFDLESLEIDIPDSEEEEKPSKKKQKVCPKCGEEIS